MPCSLASRTRDVLIVIWAIVRNRVSRPPPAVVITALTLNSQAEFAARGLWPGGGCRRRAFYFLPGGRLYSLFCIARTPFWPTYRNRAAAKSNRRRPLPLPSPAGTIGPPDERPACPGARFARRRRPWFKAAALSGSERYVFDTVAGPLRAERSSAAAAIPRVRPRSLWSRPARFVRRSRGCFSAYRRSRRRGRRRQSASSCPNPLFPRLRPGGEPVVRRRPWRCARSLSGPLAAARSDAAREGRFALDDGAAAIDAYAAWRRRRPPPIGAGADGPRHFRARLCARLIALYEAMAARIRLMTEVDGITRHMIDPSTRSGAIIWSPSPSSPGSSICASSGGVPMSAAPSSSIRPDRAADRQLLRGRSGRPFPRPSRQHHQGHRAPPLRGDDQPQCRRL